MKKSGNIAKQKTMHVLFTGLVSCGVLSGGDQLILDIVPRLPKSIRVIIVTPAFAQEFWKDIDTSNVEFRLLPRNIFEFKTDPISIFVSYVIRSFQVFRILKGEKIQTIYSCSDIAYADIWPAYRIIGKRPDVKWLTRIYHVLLPPKDRQGNMIVNAIAFRLQRLSFRLMQRRSSTVFALNTKLYDEVLPLGFSKEKLAVLEAGIDYKSIRDFKQTRHYGYDVVVLGRLAPVKGIFDAIKAWETVHTTLPKAKLAWIGSGNEAMHKKIRDQLAEKSLTKSFELLGFLEKEEVYNILRSAKVFLCSDHENGWGLAVCEAMASGLPIASYDIDIFGGVYKKGFKSAPLFDTVALGKQITTLLQDNALRKRTANDALAQAKEFDHAHVIADLLKYL